MARGKVSKRSGKGKAKTVSRSSRTGSQFPDGRIHRHPKRRTTSHGRVAVYKAAKDLEVAMEDFSYEENEVNLLTAALYQVMEKYVFHYLEFRDLFNLRAVCKQYRSGVDRHFAYSRGLCFENLFARESSLKRAFQVATARNKTFQKMNLCNCGFATVRVVAPVFENANALQELNISGCHNLNSYALHTLIEFCPKLKTLNVGFCTWVRSKELCMIVSGFYHLEVLDVSFCSIDHYSISRAFSHRCNLKALCIPYIRDVGNMTLHTVTRSCTGLKVLDIRGSNEVSDSGLNYLATRTPLLKKLYINLCSFVTPQGISNLQSKMEVIVTQEHMNSIIGEI